MKWYEKDFTNFEKGVLRVLVWYSVMYMGAATLSLITIALSR